MEPFGMAGAHGYFVPVFASSWNFIFLIPCFQVVLRWIVLA